MSDEILSVNTLFPDVASLAQGYINRVDGERLLVSLAAQIAQGEGLRFVVYLADGTAAFAGAGLVAQVSDQGANVPPAARYETLLESLAFDERSQPVYDYIVAVRNAAYSAGGEAPAEERSASEQPPSEEPIEEPIVDMAEPDEQPIVDMAEPDEQPIVDMAEPDEQPAVEMLEAVEAVEAFEAPEATRAHASSAPPSEGRVEPAADADVLSVPPSMQSARVQPAPMAIAYRPDVPSFVPEAVPTGMLKRPPRALHWQPDRPRRPTPRPHTGLFRYSGPGLPVPARAPRPDLDASALVQPAPRPS